MKPLLSVLAFLCLVNGFLHCQEHQQLADEFNRIAKEFGGKLGVAARNLSTGETIAFNGDSLFATASVIKLPVFVELFYRFHDGTLSPQKAIPLFDSLKKEGSDALQYLSGGQTLKLIDLATLMIVLSDNTATNYVIDQFALQHDDKLEAVNSRMRSLGLKNTKLLNKLYSFATKKKTEEARRFGIGVTSPNDMLLLLSDIVAGTIVNKPASDSILAILKHQTDDRQARRYLPFMEDTTLWVGNKTGSIDAVKNDIGIVGSSQGQYIYAIFTNDSKDLGEQVDNKATLAVAEVSRLLYARFMKK